MAEERRIISRSSKASGHYLLPSLLWPKTGITNTRVLCSSIRRSAAVGNRWMNCHYLWSMRSLMSTNITADLAVHHTQASEDQLVSEAKSGNREAFAELCRRYGAMLERRIFRIVRNREDSEDVLQETFLSAFLHLQSFRGTCRFSTWITKIGINASVMLLRKRKRSLTIASEVVTKDGQRKETPEFRDPRPNP